MSTKETIMDENITPNISWQVMDRYLCYMMMANNDTTAIEDMQDIVFNLRCVVSRIDMTKIEYSTLPDEVKSEIVSKFQKQKRRNPEVLQLHGNGVAESQE